MEHDHRWEDLLGFNFINKVRSILVKRMLVNIYKPVTAIIIKLATADKNSTTSAIKSYGFDVLYDAMTNFFTTLVQHLSSADYVLCSNSLCLINALMRHVSDHHWESFMDNDD
ncbi:hypothetical protein RclHR1_01130002 [Rhizophagus clarus]|uniref:ELMO armadillo-like helical domain-containing protein n=1 Tax=Rhizophagus clarus TaxID=94130 RepID=A0A2Z6QWU1_9GLOM|nr:hypothetical protein RclHR1_01130002 [Rhizophagus clarus]